MELFSNNILEGGKEKKEGGKANSESDQSYTKRPKIANTSRQESQGGSEADSNKSNQIPKMRLLDRSQLMDMMLFP